MKKIILALFLASPAMATYSGFQYQRQITIPAQLADSTTLSNFPVLISTTDPTLATTGNGGHLQNGFDLVFSTMPNCDYLLNWDTETYNSSTGNLIAWVNVPTISNNAAQNLYMCYGNSAVTTYIGVSSSAWNSSYTFVTHLSSAGASPNTCDSTGNNVCGTNNGSTSGSGQVDGAGTFNGSSNYISYPTSSALNLGSAFTISFWLYPNSGSTQNLMSKDNGNTIRGWGLWIVSSDLYIELSNNGSAMQTAYTSTATLTNNQWQYATYSYDGTNVRIYLNGVFYSMTTFSGPVYSSSLSAYIAERNPDGHFLSGSEDEIEISSIARSNDWIATEYRNQSNPSGFVIYGSETQVASESTHGLYIQGKVNINGKVTVF